jgi:hypothetical protein
MKGVQHAFLYPFREHPKGYVAIGLKLVTYALRF